MKIFTGTGATCALLTHKNLFSFFLLIGLLKCSSVPAQPLFAREYAAPTDLSNIATHCNTSDGGMILLSHTVGSTNFQHYNVVVKNSANGSMQWSRRYAVPNATVSNIIQLSDGNYCFAYLEAASNTLYKVIRLDAGGNFLSAIQYALPGGFQSIHAPRLLAKPSGGFYMAAHVRQVMMTYAWALMEVDLNGTMLWSQYYNDNVEVNIGIAACANGDIVVCGARGTVMSSANNPFITRVSSTGQLLWSKYYTFSAGIYTDAYAIQELSNGTIAVVGRVTNNAPTFNQAFCLQTDPNGTVVRAKRYGNSQSLMQANATLVVENDNLIISGNAGNFGTGSFFMKIDPVCNVVSSEFFNDVSGFSLGRTTAPGYSVSGMLGTTSHTFLFTTDSTMNTCLGDPFVIDTAQCPVTTSALTGSAVFTLTQSTFVPADTFVAVLSSDICHDSATAIVPVEHTPVIRVFPNPAADIVTIHCAERMLYIAIYDPSGKIVQQTNVNTTDHTLNMLPYAAGLYVIRIQTENSVQSLRLVVE